MCAYRGKADILEIARRRPLLTHIGSRNGYAPKASPPAALLSPSGIRRQAGGLRWNQPIPVARLKTAVEVLHAVMASKSSHPSSLRTWPSPSERPFFFSRQVYPRNTA